MTSAVPPIPAQPLRSPGPQSESTSGARADSPGADSDAGSGIGPVGRAAAATARLGALDRLSLAEHPDLYQGIHTELQAALADIDDA